MSDDERTGTDSGSGTDEEGSVEIPISTEGGCGDEQGDGVEIEVETGPPGPDVESESSVAEGLSPGDARPGGLFDRLDRRLLDLLSRGLDTETHLRVYLAVRNRPWSTPEDVAGEAGLYPRAARDALEGLEAYGVLERRGPANGTDPSREPEYAAREPTLVLSDAIDRDEPGGTDGFDLGRYLGTKPATGDRSPIRIDVEDDADATDSKTESDASIESSTDETNEGDDEGEKDEGSERADGERSE